jgi:hypothetical protein
VEDLAVAHDNCVTKVGDERMPDADPNGSIDREGIAVFDRPQAAPRRRSFDGRPLVRTGRRAFGKDAERHLQHRCDTGLKAVARTALEIADPAVR